MKINDKETLVSLLLSSGIPTDRLPSVIQTIDKLEKIQWEGVEKELMKKGIAQTTVKDIFKNLKETKPSKILTSIIQTAEKLGVSKESIIFDPTLARGLDYYTGMVFEGNIPDFSSGSVGGGGRYDNLIKELSNVAITAVGFGLGFDRTIEAAEQLKLLPSLQATARVLVTIFEGNQQQSLETARLLRENNINAELFTQPAKLDKQLKYADRKGIPYVVILGPEEIEKGMVTVKNMRKQTQQTIPPDQLSTALRL